MFIPKEEEEKLTQEFFDNYRNIELDEGMLPYLKRINSIPGIVTDFSCSGHWVTTDGLLDMENSKGYISFYVVEKVFDLILKTIYPKIKNEISTVTIPGTTKFVRVGVGVRVDFSCDWIRLLVFWHPNVLDDFMDIFLKELEKNK